MNPRLLEALEAARYIGGRAGSPTYTSIDGRERIDLVAGAQWAELAAAKFAELAVLLRELQEQVQVRVKDNR